MVRSGFRNPAAKAHKHLWRCSGRFLGKVLGDSLLKEAQIDELTAELATGRVKQAEHYKTLQRNAAYHPPLP